MSYEKIANLFCRAHPGTTGLKGLFHMCVKVPYVCGILRDEGTPSNVKGYGTEGWGIGSTGSSCKALSYFWMLLYIKRFFDCFIFREKSNLAVTLVNSDNEIVAHAAFFDYPMIPTVDQSKWEDWLRTKYECKKATVSIIKQIKIMFLLKLKFFEMLA